MLLTQKQLGASLKHRVLGCFCSISIMFCFEIACTSELIIFFFLSKTEPQPIYICYFTDSQQWGKISQLRNLFYHIMLLKKIVQIQFLSYLLFRKNCAGLIVGQEIFHQPVQTARDTTTPANIRTGTPAVGRPAVSLCKENNIYLRV